MSLGIKSNWKKINYTKELVENALRLAYRDIKAAKSLFSFKDYDWTFMVTYNALLHAGRALMFYKGYKPFGSFKHLTVFKFVKVKFKDNLSSDILSLFNKIIKGELEVSSSKVNLATKNEASFTLEKVEKFINKVEDIIDY